MNKSITTNIIIQHFEDYDRIEEIMETLQDYNLLNDLGIQVKSEIWERTTKKEHKYVNDKFYNLQKDWDTFSESDKQNLFKIKDEVANDTLREFLRIKCKEL